MTWPPVCETQSIPGPAETKEAVHGETPEDDLEPDWDGVPAGVETKDLRGGA